MTIKNEIDGSGFAFFSTDFTEAHDLADAYPGVVVRFQGVMPCKMEATQFIVRVPNGVNHCDPEQRNLLFSAVHTNGDTTTSSSVERGTHVRRTVWHP